MTAEIKIRKLAERNGVTGVRTSIDRLANDFARLAGDEPNLDEVEILLIHLAQRGIVSRQERQRLHSAYLREKRVVRI